MAGDIHRIEPDPTARSGVVRKVGPRRHRGGEEGRDFAEELEEKTEEDEDPDRSPSRDKDRAVSPPSEEDGGTHVDLVG